MSDHDAEQSDFMVISRGQWDKDARPQDIQEAIDAFYPWLESHVAAGRMRSGSRLKRDGATVSRAEVVLDGPYGEAKEVIGGYWIIVARSLAEAAGLAAQNPCMRHGLFYEIRPLDPERADALVTATETPRD